MRLDDEAARELRREIGVLKARGMTKLGVAHRLNVSHRTVRRWWDEV